MNEAMKRLAKLLANYEAVTEYDSRMVQTDEDLRQHLKAASTAALMFVEALLQTPIAQQIRDSAQSTEN